MTYDIIDDWSETNTFLHPDDWDVTTVDTSEFEYAVYPTTTKKETLEAFTAQFTDYTLTTRNNRTCILVQTCSPLLISQTVEEFFDGDAAEVLPKLRDRPFMIPTHNSH